MPIYKRTFELIVAKKSSRVKLGFNGRRNSQNFIYMLIEELRNRIRIQFNWTLNGQAINFYSSQSQ